MSNIRDMLKNMKPKPVKITVKAWDDAEVFIKALTEKQRKECESFEAEDEFDDAAKRIALVGLVDENGEPAFGNIEDMDNPIGGFLEVSLAIINRTMGVGIDEARKN